MADTRWTSNPTVIGTCPACGRDLPPIVVTVDGTAERGEVLVLTVAPQELDGPWWDEAARTHPDCNVRTAQHRYVAELTRGVSLS